MNTVLGSLEETLTALNAELERTPMSDKARRMKLKFMITSVKNIWSEAFKLNTLPFTERN